jgi:predicted transcriptional regulator
MDVLWNQASQESDLSAKAIIARLDNELDWHDRTVKTLLNRLLKKEAVGLTKQGRGYFYYPTLLESDYVEAATDNFIYRVFNGSISSLLVAFSKPEKLSEQDLIDLKNLMNKIKK